MIGAKRTKSRGELARWNGADTVVGVTQIDAHKFSLVMWKKWSPWRFVPYGSNGDLTHRVRSSNTIKLFVKDFIYNTYIVLIMMFMIGVQDILCFLSRSPNSDEYIL